MEIHLESRVIIGMNISGKSVTMNGRLIDASGSN